MFFFGFSRYLEDLIKLMEDVNMGEEYTPSFICVVFNLTTPKDTKILTLKNHGLDIEQNNGIFENLIRS